jgi:hypothetical protein
VAKLRTSAKALIKGEGLGSSWKSLRGENRGAKLNPKQVDSLPPGAHGDRNNLYLVVKDSGARSEAFRAAQDQPNRGVFL